MNRGGVAVLLSALALAALGGVQVAGPLTPPGGAISTTQPNASFQDSGARV